jgi:hypothetical protein
MPSLNFEIPNSEWAVLEQIAKRERCSVRTLVLWKLKGAFGFEIKPPQAELDPEPAAA